MGAHASDWIAFDASFTVTMVELSDRSVDFSKLVANAPALFPEQICSMKRAMDFHRSFRMIYRNCLVESHQNFGAPVWPGFQTAQ